MASPDMVLGTLYWPSEAPVGSTITIHTNISNRGDSGTAYTRIIDADTMGVLDEYSLFMPNNSGSSSSWSFVMPDKDFNIMVETGYVEDIIYNPQDSRIITVLIGQATGRGLLDRSMIMYQAPIKHNDTANMEYVYYNGGQIADDIWCKLIDVDTQDVLDEWREYLIVDQGKFVRVGHMMPNRNWNLMLQSGRTAGITDILNDTALFTIYLDPSGEEPPIVGNIAIFVGLCLIGSILYFTMK